jgi:hypothetical protein
MSNDFVYDMSEINEEQILNGWEELADEAMIRAMEDNSMSMEEYDSLPDYIPGLDDGEGYDPIMGDEYPETDDEWLDDFHGEEDFA